MVKCPVGVRDRDVSEVGEVGGEVQGVEEDEGNVHWNVGRQILPHCPIHMTSELTAGLISCSLSLYGEQVAALSCWTSFRKEPQESDCVLKAGEVDVARGDVSNEGEPSAIDECDVHQQSGPVLWCMVLLPNLD